jgi:parallel beta-helix repeat protein
MNASVDYNNTQRPYMRFTNVPVGPFSSASITLRALNSGPGIYIYKANSDFNVNNLTWNNQPSVTTWLGSSGPISVPTSNRHRGSYKEITIPLDAGKINGGTFVVALVNSDTSIQKFSQMNSGYISKLTLATAAATTTTTSQPTTTTTQSSTTTTQAAPPITTTTMSAPSTTTTTTASKCSGVAMNNGQTDINNSPAGTVFCLSGTHNWDLTPKTGDQFIGPAVLDGAHATAHAFEPGSAQNVTISNLEIRNYATPSQTGAIQATGTSTSSGWKLLNLQIHDNGVGTGGAAVGAGVNWLMQGGRYYNNRQEGITGGGAAGATVDGVEIDHNNFTDDSYTTANHQCADEAGGFKWTADNVVIKNSSIHDNACIGLWADITGNNSTITNNQIFNNWAEGIYIEISSGSKITGNTIHGNGHKGGGGSTAVGCVNWVTGAGIVAANSSNVEATNNNVYGNCNGIVGTQQNRSDSTILLQNFNVHDNAIAGPGGVTGAASYPKIDLSARNITFANNTYLNGMTFCNLSC